MIWGTGIGLHSGKKVYLGLRPAPVNTGIVFHRSDLPGKAYIKADPLHVVDTRLSTNIGDGEIRVGTIEHLMSALAGLGIDNVYVDLDGAEVPIMDKAQRLANRMIGEVLGLAQPGRIVLCRPHRLAYQKRLLEGERVEPVHADAARPGVFHGLDANEDLHGIS